jgi:hypothetical protein
MSAASLDDLWQSWGSVRSGPLAAESFAKSKALLLT